MHFRRSRPSKSPALFTTRRASSTSCCACGMLVSGRAFSHSLHVRASLNSVPGPLLRVAGGVEWVTMSGLAEAARDGAAPRPRARSMRSAGTGGSRFASDHTGPGKWRSSRKRGITCQCTWGVMLPRLARFILSGCIVSRIAASTASTTSIRARRSAGVRSVISRTWRLAITRTKPGIVRLLHRHDAAKVILPEQVPPGPSHSSHARDPCAIFPPNGLERLTNDGLALRNAVHVVGHDAVVEVGEAERDGARRDHRSDAGVVGHAQPGAARGAVGGARVGGRVGPCAVRERRTRPCGRPGRRCTRPRRACGTAG